ncbi:hypothetical protein LTR36_005276 [Oleoguttula mirabilis]|uniref:Vesicle-mediated transport protein Vid24 n=1 Tax=Oleoguttula mirabilis TaxID=1507867 RepID=A0AAV9JET9_9PEZI|nr:hypothetical protein LTR36_005276 [Oleoguttula mirabilis]
MPTPSEVNSLPSPPIEASSSRASFASCPPEEEREQHAPREERIDSSASGEEESAVEDAHMTNQEPTPEPESQPTMHEQSQSQSQEAQATGEHVEDAGITEPLTEEQLRAVGSPDVPSESDARLAQSMSTAAISSSNEPLYLTFPRDRERLQPTITSSFLRPGSKFKGTQQSDRQVYEVQVEIKDVDMAESFLCGYLRIQGLTDDHPTLTTFFEGEIIGPKHLFKTTHPSWGSSEKVDLQHWGRFPAFHDLARTLAPSVKTAGNPTSRPSANFTLKNYAQREHLFMRWKEYFLVPDHRVKTITGASFEGFYYICFNQCLGTVSGIYFHAKSEKYQQLELKHVDDGGCMGAMEFR